MPKVSVIVPIHNGKEHLKTLIQSICGQTLQDLEILLINDDSTDSSLEICQEFAEKDKRIQVFSRKHQPNEGFGQKYAIDIGREHMTGDYVYFADCDDEVITNGIETLYKAAVKNEADVVKGTAIYVLEDGRNQYRDKYKGIIEDWSLLKEADKIYHFCDQPEMWTFLTKREIIEQLPLGPWVYNDTDFVFKLKLMAKKFIYIEDYVYKWRIWEGSTSHKNDKHTFEIFRSLDNLDAFIKEHKINPEIWPIYNFYKVRVLIGQIPGIPESDYYEYFKILHRDFQKDRINIDWLNESQRNLYNQILNLDYKV